MRSSNDHASVQITDYVQSLLPPKSATLLRMEEILKKDEKWGINIGAVEGHLLQFLIRSFQIENVLEIGTQYGYSTQWMLEALPAHGSMVTLEKDPEHFKVATSLIADARCRFELGDARELLQKKQNDIFDLIFIDANKKAYPDYLAWAMEHVTSGGLIIGDNTFLFGQVFIGAQAEGSQRSLQSAMRQFNETLMKDPRFHACIIPTSEGLTVACKKS